MNPIDVRPDLGHLALPQLSQVNYAGVVAKLDAARRRPVEAAQHLQQRRLPVSGGALDGQPLAVLDVHVDALESGDDAAALVVVLLHRSQLVHDALLDGRRSRSSESTRCDRASHSTLASAAAGRSLAARQPPNPPAIRPPAMASTTAAAMARARDRRAEVNQGRVRRGLAGGGEPARPAAASAPATEPAATEPATTTAAAAAEEPRAARRRGARVLAERGRQRRREVAH